MTTVMLMIDLQNGYLRQDVRDALGWPPIWRLTEVLDECRLLLRAARDAGLPVIFSRQVPSSAGSLAINPRAGRQLAARQARLPKLTVDDQRWRTQIMDAVAPVDGDIVLDKTRPSFFTHTELDPILRSLGAQRLIVAGLQTNVCVEATAWTTISKSLSPRTLSPPTVRPCTMPASTPCAYSTPKSRHGRNFWHPTHHGIAPTPHPTTSATPATGTKTTPAHHPMRSERAPSTPGTDQPRAKPPYRPASPSRALLHHPVVLSARAAGATPL